MSSFQKDASGTTAVEFAIVFPVFIMIVFGIVQFAYAQHCESSLHFALRTASRSLMLNPDLTETQLETQVKESLDDLGDAEVEVTMTIAGSADNRTAELVGSYAPSIRIPLLREFPITYRSAVSTSLAAVDE